MSKSQYNNSNASLGANASFVGTGESTGSYVELSVSMKADQNATVYIDQSPDKVNWDIRSTHLYKSAQGGMNFNVGSKHQWFRVIITNGATAQTFMRMATYKHEEYSSAVVKGTDGEGVVRKIMTDESGKLMLTFTGEVGAQGLSAFQLAMANGFVGTEEQWLLSLKGVDGVDGTNGSNGFNGSNGVDGANGADGADGSNGTNGVDGLSAYQVWVQQGNSGTPADYLASLQGQSITVKGTLTSAQIIGLDTNSLVLNDAYFSSDSFQLFVWDGVSQWVASGSLRGQQGLTGNAGLDGVNGIDGTNGVDGVDGADGTGITTEQANAIIANTAKNSYPALDASKVATIDAMTAAIALNSVKVGITATQASAIVANSNKIGLTQAVVDDITINNAKISYTDASVVAGHTTDIGALQTAQALNDAKISYTDATLVGTHTSQIGVLQNAQAINDAKISYTDASVVAGHTTDIGALQTAQALNDAKISYTDASVVAGHTTDIATNATGIATNLVNINLLYTGLTTNASAISNLSGQIASNDSEISALQTAQAINDAKVGITPAQASAIVANTAKVSFSSANQTALTNATNNIALNTSAIALNTAKLGVLKPTVFYEFTNSGTSAVIYDGSTAFLKRSLWAKDNDGGADFTESSGVFTCVNPGSYYVNFTANGKSVGNFMHKLRKTTPLNELDALLSSVGNASSSGSHTSSTEGYGVIVASVGDTFELQIRTELTNGLGGNDAGFGVANIHAFISFCRVA